MDSGLALQVFSLARRIHTLVEVIADWTRTNSVTGVTTESWLDDEGNWRSDESPIYEQVCSWAGSLCVCALDLKELLPHSALFQVALTYPAGSTALSLGESDNATSALEWCVRGPYRRLSAVAMVQDSTDETGNPASSLLTSFALERVVPSAGCPSPVADARHRTSMRELIAEGHLLRRFARGSPRLREWMWQKLRFDDVSIGRIDSLLRRESLAFGVDLFGARPGLIATHEDRTPHPASGDSDDAAPPVHVASIVLSETAASVLRFLNDQSTSRPRTYIADNLPGDRRAVADAVTELLQHRLAEDRGKHKGVAIFPLGRSWLQLAQSKA